MLAEFDLIRRFFTPAAPVVQAGVGLGVGDDAALLVPTPGHQLAVSVDTSVQNVHFPAQAPARAIGHRALAVALSDLAAMGARSRWCFMALTMAGSEDDFESWVAAYAEGFLALCATTDTVLAGGDITAGPLTIAVTVMGEVPERQALTRHGAGADDLIAVTGSLGGGAGGLALWQRGERDLSHPLLKRYLLPEPRLQAGEALRELATSAIDISDGLLADLGHIRKASGVGAVLTPDAIPLAAGLEAELGLRGAEQAALCGGDDYELLVTLPRANLEQARQRLAALGQSLSVIGYCREAPGVAGVPDNLQDGWQHFSGETP
ncbi:thiamine-phosphate kinase [Halomonas sp. Bachu 37]|uniref:thiamine-phosphate kinase n=1 Tax=Halomonas kashgarensis TaxID=3084920 RepID=UPI003217BC18